MVPVCLALREEPHPEAHLLRKRRQGQELGNVCGVVAKRGREMERKSGGQDTLIVNWKDTQNKKLTGEQSHKPDKCDGADCPLVGGHVAQREADRIPPVQGDESQSEH